MLDRIDAYRTVLESYSRRLLPVVRWQSTDRGNVTVLKTQPTSTATSMRRLRPNSCSSV
jgi:hypothetical protein